MTIAGAFDRMLQAEDAIRELQDAGIHSNDISVVAQGKGGAPLEASNDTAAGAEAGAAFGGIAGLALGVAAFAIPGVGPIVAAGPLAVALGAGGVGALAGGILGAFTGMHIPEDDAKYYSEAVRRGGAVLLVNVADSGTAERVREILDRAGAHSPSVGDAKLQQDELAASSRPDIPQLTGSGARLYDVSGLEFNPRTSRLEDFGKG